MAPDLSFLNRLAPADPVPDAELLRRFAAGDGPAFELLVRRHAGLVWRVCRSALPADAHAAEDAFQASFLALARHAGRVRGASAAGWLARVARHAAGRRRRTARPFAPLPDVPADPPPDPVEAAETAAAVLAEVARLPARLREPVLLCLLEGCSHAEAAARLTLPVGTVASRLSRARTALRSRLARRGLAPVALVVAPAPAGVVRAGVAVGLAPSSASPVVSTLAAGAVSAMSAAFRLKLAAGLVLAAGAVTLSLSAAQAPKPAAADPPVPAAEDLAKLQGKWRVVGLHIQGKRSTPADVAGMTWTFGRDAITASDGSGEKSGRMPFTLDATRSRRWIDLTMPTHDGKAVTAVGIYKLAGDRLTLAMRDPAPAKKLGRPTEFVLDGDTGLVELVRDGTDLPPAAPAPPPKPVAAPADELAKLQGKWRVTRRSVTDRTAADGSMLTVSGDLVSHDNPTENEHRRLRLVLDPSHTPKRLTLTLLPGDNPAPEAGQVLQGIYKLDGDRLMLCLRDPKAVEQFGRPVEFTVGGGSVVLELERTDSPAVALADFQGDWKLVAANVDGKPLPAADFAGASMRVRDEITRMTEPVAEVGRVCLKTLSARAGSPAQFDLTPLDPPAGPQHGSLSGVYARDGNRLTLCYSLDADKRPNTIAPGPGVRLITLERDDPGAKLVGEWQRLVRGAAADDTLMVWTVRDTGVFRVDYLDTASGRVNVGAFAGGPGVGRWRVEGAELVLETEGWVGDKRWPHCNVERLPLESVTADALVVRRLADPRTTRWVTERYTRFPGWDKSPPAAPNNP